LSESFAMKDLGPVQQILGMRISCDRKAKKLWLSQEKYIDKVLQRFGMEKAKVVSSPLGGHCKLSSKQTPSNEKEKEEMRKIPYASTVESLMYAIVCTRPHIEHAVGVVSKCKEHWASVNWIFRYLRGTSKMSVCSKNCKSVLMGYTNADMAGDIDSRKFISS